MKLHSKVLALGLTLAAVAASASATVAPPLVNTGVISVGPGNFSADYSLGTLGRGGLNVSAFTIEVAPFLGISNATLELFSGSVGHGTEVSSYAVTDSTKSFSVNVPSSGNYYFQIIGNATGQFGGAYDILAFANNVHAVPEPGIDALLGLGVVGLIVSRRRKSAEPLVA